MRIRGSVFEFQPQVTLISGATNQEFVQVDDDQADLDGLEVVELLVTLWAISGQLIFELCDAQDATTGSWVAAATYTVSATPGSAPQTPVLISASAPRTSPMYRRRFLRWRWIGLAAGDEATFRAQAIVR